MTAITVPLDAEQYAAAKHLSKDELAVIAAPPGYDSHLVVRVRSISDRELEASAAAHIGRDNSTYELISGIRTLRTTGRVLVGNDVTPYLQR